jgi:thioredoxin reductase
MNETNLIYDAIIVGGGPAGLSAALVLGRCRRKVLLLNAGKSRNARTRATYGFLTRDGIKPAEFISVARDQLNRHTTVELLDAEAADAKCDGNRFEVTLDNGEHFKSRSLLLATGVVDEIPAIEGLDRFTAAAFITAHTATDMKSATSRLPSMDAERMVKVWHWR